jgi:hypothetical protein
VRKLPENKYHIIKKNISVPGQDIAVLDYYLLEQAY